MLPGTTLDGIVRANRLRAVTRRVVQGGELGRKLEALASLPQPVSSGSIEVGGEFKPKFQLGLHGWEDDVIIP